MKTKNERTREESSFLLLPCLVLLSHSFPFMLFLLLLFLLFPCCCYCAADLVAVILLLSFCFLLQFLVGSPLWVATYSSIFSPLPVDFQLVHTALRTGLRWQRVPIGWSSDSSTPPRPSFLPPPSSICLPC